MYCRRTVILAWSFASLILSRGMTRADDWPQWRGPHRDGRSRETKLLSNWPAEGPELLWKAQGLGDGYAGVIVNRGRVHTIGRRDGEVFAYAFQLKDGARIWQQRIGSTGRIPSSTPTADGDRLYALDPDGELVCLEAATGKIVWQRSFSKDFAGRMQSGRGYGESPLIDGDRLICTPGGPEASLVALNKHTGKVIWKAVTPELGSAGRDGAGFSSIVISSGAGVRQYVQLIGRGLVGIRATDGKFLWGYNDIANPTANIPTPVVQGDLVFAANGYNAGSVLLKLSKKEGGGVEANEIYRLSGGRFQNHHGGYLLKDGFIYGGHGSNNGLPTCLEMKTGRVVWKRRGPGVGSAAVVMADGHLYFKYQNGVIALIEVNSESYRLKSKFRIPKTAGDSWAHPAIAQGRYILREKDRLAAYRLSAGGKLAKNTPASSPMAGRLAVLKSLGVGVEELAPGKLRAETNRRSWYQHAAQDSSNVLVPLVTLKGDHLTREGRVKAEVLSLLRGLGNSLLVSAAGTRIADAGIRQLAGISGLGGLDLEFCRQVTDDGIAALAKAARLRVLMLTGTKVSAAGLRPLAQSQLAALDLEVCDKIGDDACAALANIKTLKAVNLKKTGFERKSRVTNRGLSEISKLELLEALRLYGNGINDKGMSHLKGLRNLRYLDLSLVAITDAGLKELSGLSNLRRLDLLYTEGFAGPMITNKSLATLAGFPQLRDLDVTKAAFTDEAVARLAQMKKLTSLNLVNTRISSPALQQLKRQLPTCRIKH